MKRYRNWRHGAEQLADALAYLGERDEKPIILGLVNGGVAIADVIARRLNAPLDVLLIERLHAPGSPEHVVGAVDEHGRISMIQSSARWHHLTSKQMIEPAREVYRDLQRRRGPIRAILPELDLEDRTVIIVSQGILSGAKMLGAISAVRDRGARKIVAAAPAGHGKSMWQLHDVADEVVIPHQPPNVTLVREFYEEFTEMTDGPVVALIERWLESRQETREGMSTLLLKFQSTAGHMLHCEVDLPPGLNRGSGPSPAVAFAHGFESDARSQRSVPISKRLAKRGIIGVRFDFTGHGRSEGTIEDASDQQMLEDVHTIFQNITQLYEVDPQRLGLNGSGTGGMIALYYAANQPLIRALVIRGPVCGREIDAARKVTAPTLLIHAERDTALEDPISVLDQEMRATHELLRVPNSNRMFDDPVSRELMISASADWFVDHLRTPTTMPERPVEPAEQPSRTTQPGSSSTPAQ